jgi:hypothetical protein
MIGCSLAIASSLIPFSASSLLTFVQTEFIQFID